MSSTDRNFSAARMASGVANERGHRHGKGSRRRYKRRRSLVLTPVPDTANFNIGRLSDLSGDQDCLSN